MDSVEVTPKSLGGDFAEFIRRHPVGSANIKGWPQSLFARELHWRKPGELIKRQFFVARPGENGSSRKFQKMISLGFLQPFSQETGKYFPTEPAVLAKVEFQEELNARYVFEQRDGEPSGSRITGSATPQNSEMYTVVSPPMDIKYDGFGELQEAEIDGLTLDAEYFLEVKEGQSDPAKLPTGCLITTYNPDSDGYTVQYEGLTLDVNYTFPDKFSMSGLLDDAEKNGLDPNLRYHAADDYGLWDDSIKSVDWPGLAGVKVEVTGTKSVLPS